MSVACVSYDDPYMSLWLWIDPAPLVTAIVHGMPETFRIQSLLGITMFLSKLEVASKTENKWYMLVNNCVRLVEIGQKRYFQ